MDTIPVILFWLGAVYCLRRGVTALIHLLAVSMSFGAFAVIPPQATGGLSITPAPMVSALIVARIFLTPRGMDFLAELIVKPQRLTLLLLFWVVAAATTMFAPRLFNRQITIVPLRFEPGETVRLLGPSAQNLSQLVYLTISVFLVLALAQHFRDPHRRIAALPALLLGGAVAVFTGALDFASQYAPIGPLLEPFRTASYSLMTDVEIMGGKRVVGLMPEASSYGALCIAFLAALYFFRFALASLCRWPSGTTLSLAAALILFVWLSTSSAALLGLIVFIASAGLEWMRRSTAGSVSRSLRRGVAGEFWVALAAVCALCVTFIATPFIWASLIEHFDLLVFSKTSSSSFSERSSWNLISLQALRETFGFGVGLGATRASNAVVALASNVGVLGATFYYSFVLSAFLTRAPRGDPAAAMIAHGARWAFIAPFGTLVLIGTTADFGSLNAFLYSLAIAATEKRKRSPAQGWARAGEGRFAR